MIVSHLVTQNLVSGTIISEKLGLLRTQTHDIQDNLLVVIGIVMIAAGRISLESSFALGPVLAGRHENRIAGHWNADLGLESIALRKKVIAELLLKHSQLGTDFLETGLLSFAESHSVFHEPVIKLFRDNVLLPVECGRIFQHGFYT